MSLRPYQLRGAAWLANSRYAMLADDMGLGKSAQVVTAAQQAGARKAIVICPAIGVINWRREFEKWLPPGQVPELEIHSYTSIVRKPKLRAKLRDFKADVCIADEAHYLKNPRSKRTSRIYGPGCNQHGLIEHVGAFWPVTGTPALRDAMDLWPHFHALWPDLIRHTAGVLGRNQFMERYCTWRMTQYEAKVTGLRRDTLPELRMVLDLVMLRRTAAEVAPDMPKIMWPDPITIDAGPLNVELKEMEQHEEFDQLRRVLDAAGEDLTKDLYTAADPIVMASARRLTAVIKSGYIANLIYDELRAGLYDKIVIFAHHSEAISKVADALQSFDPILIQGGQTVESRQRAIDKFSNNNQCRVAVAQQQAANHLINLEAASQVAFVEQSWLHGENVQAAMRCRRLTQTRTVFVRTFGLKGSVDEQVNASLSNRARMYLQLMDDNNESI